MNTAQQGTPAYRARAFFALKLAVTVLLCAIIVWQADWNRVGSSIASANPWWLVLVFASMVACVTISAWKWSLLLRIHGAPFPFASLHRWYFVAMFFNNFLPTSIGGDGYRVYKTLHNPRSRTSAVLSVFVERVSGILSLLVLGYLGGVIGYLADGNPLSRFVAVAGTIGLVVGVALLLLAWRLRLWHRLSAWPRLPVMVRGVLEHFDDYARAPRESWLVVLVSFGFHAFSLAWWWLLVHATGASISVADLAVVVAMLSVVAVVPLSINGIGLLDGSFIFLAGQFGVAFEPALTVMLLHRALLIPISLAGGVLYFSGRSHGEPAATRERVERSLEIET